MTELAVKRTLAAIVMADVVGYSRLMGEDETGTLQRLTQFRGEFIDATIAGHRGRVVNAIGDSLLLEFASVIDATLCAIALQQALTDRNAPLAEPKRIAFRVGVNIGDVIVQDRSLFGDSVNIAARLQTLAEPGGICLSAAAYEQIRGKVEAEFIDIGPHQVKNIARPVGAFALSAHAIGEIPRHPLLEPRRRASRRWIIVSAGVICTLVAVAFGVNYFMRRAARGDLAARLESVLSQTQANLNDRARAKLVADYLATARHRALAIAPKTQAHWWTGGWQSTGAAEEKALERCQLAFNEPCELAAVDDAMTARKGVNAHIQHEMPRVGYSGDFDPEQIPGVRKGVGKRADVAGYVKASEPKAAAIHPRGVLAIVAGAASQRDAELQALKICNDEEDAKKEGDGPCYLYARGNKVVLPRRQTSPIAEP